jgi:hypothetical protein
MLIEIWERLRGYDKWVQAEARVELSKVEKRKDSYSGWVATNVISWKDLSGATRIANFSVSGDSPLYQLIGGETVTIRYNPANPDKYYFHDLLQSRAHTVFQATVFALIFAGLLFLMDLPSLLMHK